MFTYMWQISQVIQSLKKQTSEPPKPFPISKQYKTRKKDKEMGEQEVTDDHADDEGGCDGEKTEVDTAVEKPSKKTQKNGVPKKKKAVKSVEVKSSENLYEPSVYAEKRKAFIDGLRDQGHSYTVANATWNFSQEKRKLLAGVSVPELKRRRFLPKEATTNPWAKWVVARSIV